jgi:phosphoglucomutase
LDYKSKYNYWLSNSYFDSDTISELKSISQDENEIKDRFVYDLEFGTGGLRGIIGAGTNRINIYTVRKATQGLANYINDTCLENKSVVIAYDSRQLSETFANEAALVLNANKIKTYIFDELTPTPVLSFAVRYLKSTAGIVITASHNPKDYNGYKVYWKDGAQISSPIDDDIAEYIKQIDELDKIKTTTKHVAMEEELYYITPQLVKKAYIDAVKEERIIPVKDSKLKIVYTPLNGAGHKYVKKILLETGFQNLFIVPEQAEPDPEFKTVGIPNPEYHSAFNLALQLAKEINADLVLATDPDSDRIGVVVKNKDDYIYLSGNEVGLLLTNYILSEKKLPNNPLVISTIVSSRLTKSIAESYNAKYIEVLTGFKYICRKIRKFELENNKEERLNFVFGFEESYGYLSGTYTRDKDAISSAMLICEMAEHLHQMNITMISALDNIYKKYGYQKEIQKSIELHGSDAVKRISNIMFFLREEININQHIANNKIVRIHDYYNSTITSIDDKQKIIDLPKSNVIRFEMQNKSWICVRPSGTEPKLKIYIGAHGNNLDDAQNNLKNILNDFENILQRI